MASATTRRCVPWPPSADCRGSCSWRPAQPRAGAVNRGDPRCRSRRRRTTSPYPPSTPSHPGTSPFSPISRSHPVLPRPEDRPHPDGYLRVAVAWPVRSSVVIALAGLAGQMRSKVPGRSDGGWTVAAPHADGLDGSWPRPALVLQAPPNRRPAHPRGRAAEPDLGRCVGPETRYRARQALRGRTR